MVGQRDDFPIGSLLPPTTWEAGESKPGYLALTIDRSLPPANYVVDVTVYDPNTMATVPFTVGEAGPYDQRLELATVIIAEDGTATVIPVTAAKGSDTLLAWRNER